MPKVHLRPVRSTDIEELGRIAFDTGFFGASASAYCPDRALFIDLWVRPYFLLNFVGFVAEREGRALGYIIGTLSAREYRGAVLRVLPAVLLRLLGGGYPHALGCLPYFLRVARFYSATPRLPGDAYQAHLHINLLPAARGLGLGGELLDAFLDELRERGVPGVQLSTTLLNEAAVALYEKRGFHVVAERCTGLWHPWLGCDATHIVMVRDV